MMTVTNEVVMDFFCGSKGTPIQKCAGAAYRDLRRTLRGIRYQEFKKQYIDDVCTLIEECVNDLMNRIELEQDDFDEWHIKTCEGIVEASSKYEFHTDHGQAQKWLNMTFKYMLLFNQEIGFQHYLHVPIDQYILNGAKRDLEVNRPPNAPHAWSKWQADDYMSYQIDIRKKIAENRYESPIAWEFEVWPKYKGELS